MIAPDQTHKEVSAVQLRAVSLTLPNQKVAKECLQQMMFPKKMKSQACQSEMNKEAPNIVQLSLL